jgi:hypothetical protein
VDLDGDGRQDLISGSYPGELYLFKRKPNGAFAASTIIKSEAGRSIHVGRASAVAVADLNGDGEVDLIIGNIDGAVFFVPNTGTAAKPSFGNPQAIKADGTGIKVSGGDAGPCVADWDGDGKLDLIVGSGEGDVSWYRNIGTRTEPRLAAPVILIDGPGHGASTQSDSFDNPKSPGMRTKVHVADWNGDMRPDLIVGDFNYQGSKYHGWVWVYLRKE